MKLLITGAQFGNKGAQSLLFSLINEIKNRYKNKKIEYYYVPVDDISLYNVDQFSFKFVFDNKYPQDNKDLLRKIHRSYRCIRTNMIIFPLVKQGKIDKASRIWKEMDLHIDISGFSLSSKWPAEINNRILRYIETSIQNQIPIILMPQSFGPFDFKKKHMYINNRIKAALLKVDIICARENEGMILLKKNYGISDNVFLYPDLVLSSSDIEIKNIFKINYRPRYKKLRTIHNVGIIPNEQLLSGNLINEVMEVYKNIITELMKKKKNVYIFRHSNDTNICKLIYEYVNLPNVQLILDDFDCFEFSEFVKQFDFVVASRFHSIVHSYKNYIPALVLGWATKYVDLVGRFNQEKYLINFDRDRLVDKLVLANIVDTMCDNYNIETIVIKNEIDNLKGVFCYEKLWKLMDELF